MLSWQRPLVHIIYIESFSNTDIYISVAWQVDINTLANDIGEPNFQHCLQSFLHKQLEPDAFSSSPSFYLLDKPYVYSSAIATFYTPSDLCGTGGMCCEHMHAVTSWVMAHPDMIPSLLTPTSRRMCGLSVAQARLFFSIIVNHVKYQCALAHWYSLLGNSPDECTGMWVVEPRCPG